ncbi:MAG TPA: hypothetical protein VFV31_02540 [Chitinophagaceae bacterium]|nr:hypothetical protein [Chitinophagaceae bacterium]
MSNRTSQHILGTATNLLGFCLLVITSLHVSEKSQNSLIDEFASVVAILLTISCILSFASIKAENKEKEQKLESLADFLFVLALGGILFIVLYLTIKLWNL